MRFLDWAWKKSIDIFIYLALSIEKSFLMNTSPKYSILVITYNRANDCLELLQNIEKQQDALEYIGEVLLLNNNSSDSYEKIKTFAKNTFLPLRYIEHDKNLGVAGGRNFLIKRAACPYLLVLDDDVLFDDENAMKVICNLFSKEQYVANKTAVVTLSVHYYDTKERQKNALPHKSYNEYKDKDWFLTYYFAGGAHIVKKEVFDNVGYYPEDFFYGMEEYDLSYRIIDAGYTLAYDNSVKIWHKESPQGRIPNKKKMAMLWYNKSKVAWKYLPKKYFYTTAFMWSLQYLKMTHYDILGLLKNWAAISKIPAVEKRKAIGSKALNYLKKVSARLTY